MCENASILKAVMGRICTETHLLTMEMLQA